ncbi:siderophore-interacting protein [Schumannella sp. 10F1B-5-1]|uniref:siderophore-interacting protein n=1 Tax=Schumannella sp. 10F1B-5-1 TaxID=2590780 RepID=UPI001131803E|nr:siderophore-interacting protein [Schumannella sp. 10F1B-5-1]TPW72336.1 siderophore-interacting protein [Schumannella sp. 10F1B-5-1]
MTLPSTSLSALDLAPSRAGIRTVTRPLRRRVLTVVAVHDISASLVRVVLAGEAVDETTLAPFAPVDHVKLFFPDAQGELHLPEVVDDRPAHLDRTRAIFRDYTVRDADPDAGTLTIDFVRHDHGPAGRWAIAARPGDEIGVLGPRGSHVYPDGHARYVLVADETAIPALARWLSAPLAEAEVHAVAVVASADDVPELPSPPLGQRRSIQVVTAPQSERAEALAAAVKALDPAHPDTFWWIAGEAGSIAPLRRTLRDAGVDRGRRDIDGYWRVGVANLDHHVEDDD